MPSAAPLKKIEDSGAFAQAMLDALHRPLLVLDNELRVISASRSYCNTFQASRQDLLGRRLGEIGGGVWDITGLQALLRQVGPEEMVVEGYEVERDFPLIGHRTMLLKARKVLQDGLDARTILVSFEDISARRAEKRERDDLLRQKQILLEEMQHRVGNSLQIIASILLMKARAVRSEEARACLRDTHRRVIAVAAVQNLLHESAGADVVRLEPYLSGLCANLAGAMIPGEDDAIKLNVHVDGAEAPAAVAVNLGLIVTELVINALKHAFPAARAGSAIDVSYASDGADWRLSVSDNGVGGKPEEGEAPASGLGASIVGALAAKLGARVQMSSGPAGTSVTITHGTPRSQIELAESAASGAPSQGLYVLVVEDDDADAYLIERVLAAHPRVGPIVRTANGVAALDLIKESAPPDLAIIDLHMPRKDGFSLLVELTSCGPHFPMIALTSSTATADTIRGKLRGADQVLTKPDTIEDLRELLNGAIAKVRA